MGVLDGQPVSQAITNPAFINKNQNDTMSNILGFNRALSGASIADIQAAVNKLYTATGASESTTGTVYGAPASTITDGQSHQTALSELAFKFDPTTGHKHTGAAGDAPAISSGSISGTALNQYFVKGSTITGATGTSTNVTSLMSGLTPSSNSTTQGVIVNTPNNRVFLQYADSGVLTDAVIDSTGNLIYGRLTYSAGTWTLSYYSLIAGVETAYSFGSATNLQWYYRELANPIVTTNNPIYSPVFELFWKNVKSVNSLYGDISLTATGGTTITPLGQSLLFSSPALSTTVATDVTTSSAQGSGTTSARADHAHQGVHSISKSGASLLYGDVTLSPGSNVTLTQVGQDISIASTGAGITSIGTIDSQTKSANGGVIVSNTLYFQTADTSYPGLMSINNQSFAGVKTFTIAIQTPQINLTGATSGYISHYATAVTSTYNLIWPATQASGTQFLSNDGLGNLSWASTASGNLIANNNSSGSVTISSGTSLFNPYLNIQSGHTYTVQSSAELVGVDTLTVAGTLDVTGTVVVLDGTPGVQGVGYGGTGLTTFGTGDLLYASSSSVLSRRAIGTTGQVLRVTGGVPVWGDPPYIARTQQIFQSGGSSGTYTTPAGVLYLKVRMVGGGGAGGSSGTGATAGGSGGVTTFGASLTCNGGSGGSAPPGVTGNTVSPGTATGGDLNISGGYGEGNPAGVGSGINGGYGGATPLGPGGPPGITLEGGFPGSGFGSGGGGASNNAGSTGGGGGAGGGYLEKLITSPSATYAYAVAAGGTPSAAGTLGNQGGTGGIGVIIVEEYYQ